MPDTHENATVPTPSVREIRIGEFLEPLEITPYRPAKEVHVATSSILDIVHDRRGLTVDMALRLSRYFGTSERFRLNLQNEIDIRNRRESLARDLETIHPIQYRAVRLGKDRRGGRAASR